MKMEYVFCVDSDGCAMDTMTYKHELFFGPLAADVFGVKDDQTFKDSAEGYLAAGEADGEGSRCSRSIVPTISG